MTEARIDQTKGIPAIRDGRYESVTPTIKLHAATGNDPRRWDDLPIMPAPGVSQADLTTFLNLYTANPWVFAAITRTALAVSSVRRLYFRRDGGQKVRVDAEETDLGRLLESPNPFMTWEDLIELSVIDLKAIGWCFWERSLPEQGVAPIGLWRLRPDRVRILPDPIRYWRGIEFQRSESAGDKLSLGPDEVVMFRCWSPVSDYHGASSLFPAQSSIVWDLFARTWNSSVFRNGAAGLPEGVFTTDRNLNEDTEKRIKQTLKNRLGHPDVWRDILILDNGLKFQPTAVTSRDMQFVEMLERSRDEILAVLGVPPAMVGVPLAGGLGGYREQRNQFYQVTVLPLLKKIEATINRYLAQPGEKFEFDINDILSLIEDLEARTRTAESQITRGIMTINEVRAEIGLAPVPWGESWWAPLGLAPVEAAGRPARPPGLETPGAAPEAKVAGEKLEDYSIRADLIKAAQRGLRPIMARRIAGAYRAAFGDLKRKILDRFRAAIAGSRVAKAGDETAGEIPGDFRPFDEGEFQDFVAEKMIDTLRQEGNRAGRAAASAIGVSFRDLSDDPRFLRAFDRWKNARIGSTARTITDGINRSIEGIRREKLPASGAIRRLEADFDRLIDERIADLAPSDATTFSIVATEIEGAERFTHKQWVTAGDADVRDRPGGESHAAMANQIVPIDQPFNVPGRAGLEKMDAPGDPAGGPWNTSGPCRCHLVLLTAEEASALGA